MFFKQSRNVLYLTALAEGFWSFTIWPKEHLNNSEKYIFYTLFDLSLVLNQTNKQMPICCPWLESYQLYGVLSWAVFFTFCSFPNSCDGVSVWPEGTRGHDVNWHPPGLLPGGSMRPHPQVSSPCQVVPGGRVLCWAQGIKTVWTHYPCFQGAPSLPEVRGHENLNIKYNATCSLAKNQIQLIIRNRLA